METPKTFAETKRKSYNWNRVLKMKVPYYFDQKIRDMLEGASERAGDWVSCAVGNQCSIIPRSEDGEPIDQELYILGKDFNYVIQTLLDGFNDFDYDRFRVTGALIIANEIMDKIEERSLILIMKELEKQNK